MCSYALNLVVARGPVFPDINNACGVLLVGSNILAVIPLMRNKQVRVIDSVVITVNAANPQAAISGASNIAINLIGNDPVVILWWQVIRVVGELRACAISVDLHPIALREDINLIHERH